MTLKVAIPWVTVGAAVTAGLVWAGRASRRREHKRWAPHDEPLAGEQEPSSGRREQAGFPSETGEAMARRDALHDMGMVEDGFSADSSDVERDTRRDPLDVETPEAGETARPTSHLASLEEPYDALDAEDLGTQWLFRATESMPHEGPPPEEPLSGPHLIDPAMSVVESADLTSALSVSERSDVFDLSDDALAEYAAAGDDDVDRAAELPVGHVDAAGNTELHAATNPLDAFEMPPTGELSLTEEELARRAAAQEAARRGER